MTRKIIKMSFKSTYNPIDAPQTSFFGPQIPLLLNGLAFASYAPRVACYAQRVARYTQRIIYYTQRVACYRQRVAYYRQCVACYTQRVAYYAQRVVCYRPRVACYAQRVNLDGFYILTNLISTNKRLFYGNFQTPKRF